MIIVYLVLCLINYINELNGAGVISLKIEGRMKSEYYIATVINAYRRALDKFYRVGKNYNASGEFLTELQKTAHREFTTAYLLGENDRTENFNDSQSKGTHKFIASVIEDFNGEYAVIEMRNRFMVGDELEILSPSEYFNEIIKVEKMTDLKGAIITDAKIVQQKIRLYTSVPLKVGDILRLNQN